MKRSRPSLLRARPVIGRFSCVDIFDLYSYGFDIVRDFVPFVIFRGGPVASHRSTHGSLDTLYFCGAFSPFLRAINCFSTNGQTFLIHQ